jgi:hypothetical protein
LLHKIVEVEGVAGKTVQRITVTNEFNFRDITVLFSDQTAIHFSIRPRIEIEPKTLDWKNGNGEIVREYDVIYQQDVTSEERQNCGIQNCESKR